MKMKPQITCPFCEKKVFVPSKHCELWTMGNGDYVHIECPYCEKEFWITEAEWDNIYWGPKENRGETVDYTSREIQRMKDGEYRK